MGHLLNRCPLDYTFDLSSEPKTNPHSLFLHSLQANTWECLCFYINMGLPSFNSPPCPSYIISLQMSTVIHLPLVMCPILQQRQVIIPSSL